MGQDIEYNNNTDIINLPDILIGHSLGAQVLIMILKLQTGKLCI